jgi:hypothetical protein
MFKAIIAGLALLIATTVVAAEEVTPWALYPDDHIFDSKIGTVQPIRVGCKSLEAAQSDGRRWIENPENWDTKDNSKDCLDLMQRKAKKRVPMMILNVIPSGLNKEATYHLFIIEAVDAKKRIWYTWAYESISLPSV